MAVDGDCAASASAETEGGKCRERGSCGLGDERTDGEEIDDRNGYGTEESDDALAGSIRGCLDDAAGSGRGRGQTSDMRAAELGASQAPSLLWCAPHGQRKLGAQYFYAARQASVDTVLCIIGRSSRRYRTCSIFSGRAMTLSASTTPIFRRSSVLEYVAGS